MLDVVATWLVIRFASAGFVGRACRTDMVNKMLKPDRSPPDRVANGISKWRPERRIRYQSTTSVGTKLMDRDKLKKFGEISMTESWTSRNSCGVPSPLM